MAFILVSSAAHQQAEAYGPVFLFLFQGGIEAVHTDITVDEER